jgi:3-hydroxybutyryl-CoA dehydrogenase
VDELRTIAVIGAGRLGRRLAYLASLAGYQTILEDVLPSNLRKAESGWAEFGGAGVAPAVRYASSVEDAVREADLIIDCVPDELESKLEIFSLLDRMAPPRSILATPTRALSIADLASCTYRADQCVAVELPDALLDAGQLPEAASIALVTTSRTRPKVVQTVTSFWGRLGFEVLVRPDAREAVDAPEAT